MEWSEQERKSTDGRVRVAISQFNPDFPITSLVAHEDGSLEEKKNHHVGNLLFYELDEQGKEYEFKSSKQLKTRTSKLFIAHYCEDVDLSYIDGSEEEGFFINVLKNNSDDFERISIEPSSSINNVLCENGIDFRFLVA